MLVRSRQAGRVRSDSVADYRNSGRKKGVRSVAINVKAWHKLQDPLVAAKVKSKSAPPKESKSKTGAKAPTAAELKAKRKKQDDQLKRYTDEWKCKALRARWPIVLHHQSC